MHVIFISLTVPSILAHSVQLYASPESCTHRMLRGLIENLKILRFNMMELVLVFDTKMVTDSSESNHRFITAIMLCGSGMLPDRY